MHDFVVNLDLPEEIGTSLAWPLVGWALAITVPWAIWRYSCASGASTRSGSGSSSN